ncbi:unnamed protein product [Calicophoron daubneyi]|uniref:Palmitoyltransferase n=1 Tax=Calicophoron daubneyi TaxID=300641 RepID=A0AAV2T9A1_CALDB
MSWADHRAASSSHTQEAPTRRTVEDDGQACVARGQAIPTGAVKSTQTIGGCLSLKHDAVPRHYSHGVATRCEQYLEDSGVRRQTAGEHPLLEQARSRRHRAIPHAQLHCIFDLSMKGLSFGLTFRTMYVTRQPGLPVVSLENQGPWEILNQAPSVVCAQYFISQPVSVLEVKDSLGYSLLHRACLKCDALVVAALLQAGLPADVATNAGVRPIHLAAGQGQPVILFLLARAGANLGQTDSKGRIALHYAVERDQVLTVAWLLAFPQAGRPDSPDRYGVTPLHLACAAGKIRTLKYMLQNNRIDNGDKGWNLFARDCLGNTCLHAAFTPQVLNASAVFSQTCASVKNQAKEVTWTLLTSQLTTSSPHPLELTQMKNNANQVVSDLASKWHVGRALLCLLCMSQMVSQNCSANMARGWLLRFYSFSWFLSGSLPFVIFFIVSILNLCLNTQLFHLFTIVLLVWISSKQRHRMDDATNRPNPFFAGVFILGVLANLYAFVVDLYPVSLAVFFGGFQSVLMFSLFSLVLLLFLILIYSDPGRVTACVPKQNQDPIIDLVMSEGCLILNQLQNRMQTQNSSPHWHLIDQYCPYCRLVLDPHGYVKHCKLCECCLENMDHHCLFIMTCVARRNQRWFILFLITCVTFGVSAVYAFLSASLLNCFTTDCLSSFRMFTDGCLCAYSHFPRCIIMLPVDLCSILWALCLLHDQFISVATRVPVRLRIPQRRTNLLCFQSFRLWKVVLHFIVTNKLPVPPAQATSDTYNCL